MEERVFFTVSQVNTYIKSIFEADKHLRDIIVKGEISNFKLHTSGHMYMSLKDDAGVLRAVMFKGSAGKLQFTPQNGMKIIAHGRVAVYERDGQYQLYIDGMQPDGVGALHMAYEQLKAKLADEGLFDERHKKPLPKYPKKVGIVTASTGAAVRDVLNILSRRFKCADVLLYPVLVQGEGASAQISEAIHWFNENNAADVLIVGRGGGSIEDLWAFNEEIVARAIFGSEIPIVSAVGHEVDFTIADFVADMRAPTPSAAAELVVPSQIELSERIGTTHSRILFCARQWLQSRRTRIESITDKPIMRNPAIKIDERRVLLDNIQKHFENAAQGLITKKRQQFLLNTSKLDALSPLNVMTRGYAAVKSPNGELVKSAKQLKTGDTLDVVLKDGIAICEVKKVI
ncbi:MAG: exodeoxyribonuclease VII large subunit [Oscillospiraceae bacterium]|nr:exodeoxyribonuclease VII large subunit [Oscillospiraceae bacterium]